MWQADFHLLICASPPRLLETAGKRAVCSAAGNVSAHAVLHCDQEERTKEAHMCGVSTQLHPAKRMRVGEGQWSPPVKVKMAQFGDQLESPPAWTAAPPNPASLFLFPPNNPGADSGIPLLSHVSRGKGSPGPVPKFTGGQTGIKRTRLQREGCRAVMEASSPGPGPELCPLRSRNSIFHLFSHRGDVFFSFLFLREQWKKEMAEGHNPFQGNFRSAGKGE